MLCISIGCLLRVHTDTKTLSFTCCYIRAILNCACPLNGIVLFWKLDAHQPVKPPFFFKKKTALNKSIRFIWTGSEVLCYAMLCIVAFQPPTLLSFFNLTIYSRFSCCCCCCTNESISICCRLVQFRSPSYRSFVHTICALSILFFLCFAWIVISTFCSKQNKNQEKKVQT